MPPRGVSWEERVAIISLAKLLDFRDDILPKSFRVIHLKNEVLDASKIQQHLLYKNLDHNALQRES